MDQQAFDQQVAEIVESEQAQTEWGITAARRYARIALVLLVVVTAATAVGAAAYFLAANPQLVGTNTSGLALVIALAAVILALRFFQLRQQRADVEDFIPFFERRLTGEAEHDTQAQTDAEGAYEWKSRHYTMVIRMIALAMLVLVTINTYQGNVMDMGRQLVFDGCIAVVITSFAWNQFAFREELLSAELLARTKASVRYRNSPAYQQRLAEQAAREEAPE